MIEITHVLPPSDTRSRHAANMGVRLNYNDYAAAKSTLPGAVYDDEACLAPSCATQPELMRWEPLMRRTTARRGHFNLPREDQAVPQDDSRISGRQRGAWRATKRGLPVRVIL